MRLPTLLSIVLLAAPAALPSAALGDTTAPPGNSGISQYVEVVPGATGGRPSTHKSDKTPLSTKAQRQLDGTKTGRNLSSVIASTSPVTAATNVVASTVHVTTKTSAKHARRHHRAKATTTSTTTSTPTTAEQAKKAALVAAAYKGDAGGGPGSGIGVPLIVLMGGAALAVGGIALARRRGGAGPVDGEPEL